MEIFRSDRRKDRNLEVGERREKPQFFLSFVKNFFIKIQLGITFYFLPCLNIILYVIS